jgi:CO/xanthine dehydrogenase FAD-binding subunit
MIPPFDVKVPATLEEACEILWQARGNARIIGGGTDLVISLRNRKINPVCLIDITRIQEIRRIEEDDGHILIGAAATHADICSSPLVMRYGKVLSDATSLIGSPQIRNLGTIGGNIVNASPAADTLPPLMVLDARVKVVSKEGERELPFRDLFDGPYKTILKPHEILSRIAFRKLPKGWGSSFVRLARRGAMAIARMSVAVVIKQDRRTRRTDVIRISAGSVTPRPERMSDAEACLKGNVPEDVLLELAAKQVSAEMIRRTGVRPSTSYKKPVIEALCIRAIKKALGEGL